MPDHMQAITTPEGLVYQMMLRILVRASEDVEKHRSVDALAFLLTGGVDLDDKLHNNGGRWVRNFCIAHKDIIDTATIEEAWGFDINSDEWNEKEWETEEDTNE